MKVWLEQETGQVYMPKKLNKQKMFYWKLQGTLQGKQLKTTIHLCMCGVYSSKIFLD